MESLGFVQCPTQLHCLQWPIWNPFFQVLAISTSFIWSVLQPFLCHSWQRLFSSCPKRSKSKFYRKWANFGPTVLIKMFLLLSFFNLKKSFQKYLFSLTLSLLLDFECFWTVSLFPNPSRQLSGGHCVCPISLHNVTPSSAKTKIRKLMKNRNIFEKKSVLNIVYN